MTKFVVSRIATRNPEINGRTLYLQEIGLWTLVIDRAYKFSLKEQARIYAGEGCKVVEVQS